MSAKVIHSLGRRFSEWNIKEGMLFGARGEPIRLRVEPKNIRGSSPRQMSDLCIRKTRHT